MTDNNDLARDIAKVLNKHSQENPSGTPDFILGDFLTGVLMMYNDAVQKRGEWRHEEVEFNPGKTLLNHSEDQPSSHFQKVMNGILEQQTEARVKLIEHLLQNPGFLATYDEDFVVEYGDLELWTEENGVDRILNQYVVRLSQKLYFRRRTDEERSRDLANDQLRKNPGGDLESV